MFDQSLFRVFIASDIPEFGSGYVFRVRLSKIGVKFNEEFAAKPHLFVFMCILFLCHYNCVYVIFAEKCNKEEINFLCYAFNKVMIFQALFATEYLMFYF